MKNPHPLVLTGLGLVVVIVALMFLLPFYNVWQQEMSGQAALAKAAQTRQILVTQAEAERDAAVLRAQAIATIGEAAQKYPEYRQQEFLASFGEALREGHISQIAYIPTEAMIPITEATRKVGK